MVQPLAQHHVRRESKRRTQQSGERRASNAKNRNQTKIESGVQCGNAEADRRDGDCALLNREARRENRHSGEENSRGQEWNDRRGTIVRWCRENAEDIPGKQRETETYQERESHEITKNPCKVSASFLAFIVRINQRHQRRLTPEHEEADYGGHSIANAEHTEVPEGHKFLNSDAIDIQRHKYAHTRWHEGQGIAEHLPASVPVEPEPIHLSFEDKRQRCTDEIAGEHRIEDISDTHSKHEHEENRCQQN